ncbi:DMT family transporter [Oceanicaulis alexandrii]|uniref:DMT family transporter n=1 Tax=Oceanicaulis alexandrii TaxID=153233 RepID=UPI0035D03502
MTREDPGVKGWGALGLLALLWGGAFAFIAVAVDTLPPSIIVLSRLTLAAVVLTAWVFYRRRRFPPLRDVRWLWFLGLGLAGNALPFLLIAIGQKTVPSGIAGILMGMMPLTVIAAAHFLLPNERLTARKGLGFVIGFSGIVILMGPAALKGMLEVDFLAQLLIFIATLCYAANAVMYQAAPETPPSVIAAGSMICAAVLSLPVAIYDLVAGPPISPSLPSILAVIALGLLPTALATIVYMTIARKVGAAFIALINYMVPVVAAIIGLLRGEEMTLTTLIALCVILLGVYVARRKPKPYSPRTGA